MEDRYLFKAKRIDNGEWVIGYIVRYGYTGREKYYIIPSYASDLYCFLIDKNTICQCTGLKDKNGNLVWENDIVHGKIHENYGYRKLVGVVQYYIDTFKVNVEPNSFFGNYKNISNTCEVIGNIFDNPELLESEDKNESSN